MGDGSGGGGAGGRSVQEEAPKKATRKLRRRNPPPSSGSAKHQKLPSAASSIVSLPRSRPASSRSNNSPRGGGGWFSRALTTGGRKSMDANRAKDEWMPDEFRRPAADPPAPALQPLAATVSDVAAVSQVNGLGSRAGNDGAITPPEIGSPTGNPASADINNTTPSRLVGALVKPKSRERSYSSGNYCTDLSAFSLLDPPPPVPPRPQQAIGAFQQSSANVRCLPELKPKSKTFPIDNSFLLPPTVPFVASGSGPGSAGRASPSPHQYRDITNSSPFRDARNSPTILSPLRLFQASSGATISARSSISSQDSMVWKDALERPPISPKHPGRKTRPRSLSRSPQLDLPSPSESAPPTPKTAPSTPLPLLTPQPAPPQEQQQEQQQLAEPAPLDHSPVELEFGFHAVTAEEPILLPTRSSTQSSSATSMRETSPVPVPEPKKKERRGSFMGGWKLAMKNSSRGDRASRDGGDTLIDDGPVGVGAGGGWIYRRRNSFSSPRPPITEKAQHKTYAQEYKEFRKPKAMEGSSSGQGSSPESNSSTGIGSDASTPANTFAARAAAAGIKPSELPTRTKTEPLPSKTVDTPSATPKSLFKAGNSTRKNFKDKMKSVEARFNQKNPESKPAAAPKPVPTAPAILSNSVNEENLVGLDVAVRQMQLLEEQLNTSRPPSPPDSRDGEKDGAAAPLTIVNASESRTSSIKDDGSDKTPVQHNSVTSIRSNLPCPPPGSPSHKKQKSQSPLRNEVGPNSASPPPQQLDKGKAKERDCSVASSKHSAGSVYPPPSEYLGKNRASSTLGASRPPTPPKPVAKLFVICCRCKVCNLSFLSCVSGDG